MKDLAPNSCQKMKMSGLCKNTNTVPKYRCRFFREILLELV